MDLDQVALQKRKSGWIHECFVKSVCEGGAIETGKMRKDQHVLGPGVSRSGIGHVECEVPYMIQREHSGGSWIRL